MDALRKFSYSAILAVVLVSAGCGDDNKLRATVQDLENDRATHLAEIESLKMQLDECRTGRDAQPAFATPDSPPATE